MSTSRRRERQLTGRSNKSAARASAISARASARSRTLQMSGSASMLSNRSNASKPSRASAPRSTGRPATSQGSHTVSTLHVEDDDDMSVESIMPWKTPRKRNSTGGFATRSQLLNARRDERWKPAGMGAKVAGKATGVVYTEQDQAQLVLELMGLAEEDDTHFKTKKKMLAGNLMPFRRPGLDYIEKPLYPTRTALLAARRKAMLPPMSYDFNGDGVVDNFELFLGRRIDVNGDGDISDTERANAKAILKQIKENYVFGLDAAGANNNLHMDIEQRAKKHNGSFSELELAKKEHQQNVVVPPWAVSARRGFHDSARSGFGTIGVAYTAAEKVKRERERVKELRAKQEELLRTQAAGRAHGITSMRPPATGASKRPPSGPAVNTTSSARSAASGGSRGAGRGGAAPSVAPTASTARSGMSGLIGV